MKIWQKWSVGLVSLASLTPSLSAQAPTPPPAAGAAAAAAAPAAPAPAVVVAQRPGCLDQIRSAITACKEKVCASPLGGFLNNAVAPLSTFSGGLIGPICPPPTPAQLASQLAAQGLDNPQQVTAAKIMQDEANAPARRAAVRYLGTVDCNWWPDAADALSAALRADRNECVRWEAALALGRGCCCTKKTVAALTNAVSLTPKDGKPVENSERVRDQAQFALDNCLARVSQPAAVEQPVPPVVPKIEGPQKPPPPPIEVPMALNNGFSPLPPYYNQLDRVPLSELIADGQMALAQARETPGNAPVSHTGDHSIYGVLRSAMSTTTSNRPPRFSAGKTSDVQPAAAVDSPQQATYLPPANAQSSSPAAPSTKITSQPIPDSQPAAPAVPVRQTPNLPVSNAQPATNGRQSTYLPVSNPQPAATTSRQMTYLPVSNRQPETPMGRQMTYLPMANARPAAPAAPVRQVTNLQGPDTQPSGTGTAPNGSSAGTGPIFESRAEIAARAPAQWPNPASAPVVEPSLPPLRTEPIRPVQMATPPWQRVADAPRPQPAPVTQAAWTHVENPHSQTSEQLVAILRNSTNFGQRERAVYALPGTDWQRNPEVAPALLEGAQDDWAPTVRVACVRTLGAMGMRTPSVVNVLRSLTTDQDAQVRRAAEDVLVKLAGS